MKCRLPVRRGVKVILNVLSVIASIVSAALWFRAAVGVTLDAADFVAYDGATPDSVGAFAKQTRRNGHAALATGLSAVLPGSCNGLLARASSLRRLRGQRGLWAR